MAESPVPDNEPKDVGRGNGISSGPLLTSLLTEDDGRTSKGSDDSVVASVDIEHLRSRVWTLFNDGYLGDKSESMLAIVNALMPEDLNMFLQFAEEVAKMAKQKIPDSEWTFNQAFIQSGLPKSILTKDGQLPQALWIQFLCVMKAHISSDYHFKYNTLEEFLTEYAPRFSNHCEFEQQKLMGIANWMQLMFAMVPAKKNKGLSITVVPKVVEGCRVKYITGSGQTSATADRVHIYEHEGHVKPYQRGKLHRERENREKEIQKLIEVNGIAVLEPESKRNVKTEEAKTVVSPKAVGPRKRLNIEHQHRPRKPREIMQKRNSTKDLDMDNAVVGSLTPRSEDSKRMKLNDGRRGGATASGISAHASGSGDAMHEIAECLTLMRSSSHDSIVEEFGADGVDQKPAALSREASSGSSVWMRYLPPPPSSSSSSGKGNGNGNGNGIGTGTGTGIPTLARSISNDSVGLLLRCDSTASMGSVFDHESDLSSADKPLLSRNISWGAIQPEEHLKSPSSVPVFSASMGKNGSGSQQTLPFPFARQLSAEDTLEP